MAAVAELFSVGGCQWLPMVVLGREIGSKVITLARAAAVVRADFLQALWQRCFSCINLVSARRNDEITAGNGHGILKQQRGRFTVPRVFAARLANGMLDHCSANEVTHVAI